MRLAEQTEAILVWPGLATVSTGSTGVLSF